MARLLVLDLGGTAVRAAVVDGDGGNIVSRAARAVSPLVDAPPLGRSYDPSSLWDAACRALRDALGAAGGAGSVAAVAVTAQRIGCAALDGQGAPLYVGPNLDTRGVATGWAVAEAAGEDLYARSGRALPFLYAPARLVWLRQERPEVFARIRHVLGLGDWLALRLCGEMALEPSSAVDLLALDVRTGAVWTELWEGCGLDPSWLPPLRPAGERLGAVTGAASRDTGIPTGTPVAVTAADSACAMLGAGAAAPGTVLVLAGSTLPVLAATGGVISDPRGRVWIGRHPVAGRGVVESNGGAAGFAWAWTAERMVGALRGIEADAAYQAAEELAAASPPGAHDALHYAGSSGVLDAAHPSTFLAQSSALFWPVPVLQPDLGAADVVRATLESVAHVARANVEQVEEVCAAGAQRLVVAGGMARSRLFLQMLAALLEREVHVPGVLDASFSGAAACAAVAAGLHASLDAAAAALVTLRVAEPPDPALVAAYAGVHRRWRALYKRVESLP